MSVAAFDAVVLLAGFGVLVGTGFVRRPADALRLAGLAFVLGWASLGTLLSLALVVGLRERVWLVVGLGLALAAGGAVAARVVLPAARRSSPRPGWLALGAAGVGAVYLAWILHGARGHASTAWDAWGFWLPKAATIYFFGGLDTGLGGFASFANPDYPPLLPALDAAVFGFAGSVDAALLPLQEWLLLVGFLWGAAGLLVRRLPATPVALGLLLVALAPDFGGSVGQSLGDLPLALLLATAAILLGLWLLEAEPRLLVPAAILLAAAAATKKEGTALALLVVLATAVARRSRRALLPLAAVACGPVAMRVVWTLWLRANDVATGGDYRLGDLADPGYLSHRWGRLDESARRVPGYVFGLERWGLALPLALLLAVLVRRRHGTMLLVFTGLSLLGLVAVYWISFLPLQFHLETSAARTALPVVVVATALLPFVLAAALAEQRVRGASQPVLEPDGGLEAERLAGG